MQATRLFTILILSSPLLFSATAAAQVFNPGPSDPSLFTHVINLPMDILPRPTGGVVGETIQVNFADGGTVGQFFEALDGSEINISGGSVGPWFGVLSGSEVNLSGGSVGLFFNARDGSLVNISGGTVQGRFEARAGSLVNISGGSLGADFEAHFGSLVNINGGTVEERFDACGGCEVNISGGTLGREFYAYDGSEVNISGGTVGDHFEARGGSEVELVGGEFKLNGESFTSPTIALGANDVFTGTLADGSAFIFSEHAGDIFSASVRLTLSPDPLPESSLVPTVVATPIDNGPQGLREGQSLTLQTGGELGGNFAIVGATLNVEEGRIGEGIEVTDGVLNINGGSVGNYINAFDGSEVNISGGTVGRSVNANRGSVVNISGGSVDRDFRANEDSIVNLSGGSLGDNIYVNSGSVFNISGGSATGRLRALDGSEVNISGGTVGFFDAFAGSNINLRGRDFVLDGVLLEDLVVGEAFIILDRDVTLSGQLADGTAISLDLKSDFQVFQDSFDSGATLTLTLSEFLLGDCNLDGVVDFLDIVPFIAVLTAGDFLGQADTNEDGVVNFLDIVPFIALLTS